MSNNNDVTIRIGAELRGIKEAINDLRSQMQQAGKASVDASERATRANKEQENSITSLKKQVIGLVGAYASIATVKGLARLADEAKNIDARLKLATRSAQEHLAAQQAIYDIANRTKTSLGGTADLYSRISIATKEMSFSQKTILDITETINKAVQLSGASDEASNAALIQLGQGLASGTLRGDELNSVMEQTPRLARAIAEGMGITIGQLRNMGQQGKITAETIINALQSQGKTLDDEFKNLPNTIGRSTTLLENKFMHFIATMDASTGTSSAVAKAIALIADHLQEVAAITGVIGTIIVTTYVVKGVPAVFAYIVQLKAAVMESNKLTASMGKTQKSFSLLGAAVAGWEIGTYLEQKFLIVKQAGIALMAGLHKAWVQIAAFFEKAGVELAFIWTHPFDAIRERIAELFDMLGTLAEKIPGIGDKIAKASRIAAEAARSKGQGAEEYRAKLAAINAKTAKELAELDKGYGDLFVGATNASALKSKIKPNETAPDAANKNTGPGGSVDQLAVLKARIERELQLLDQAYQKSEVSHAAYFERRKDLALQLVDIEIGEHQKALKQIQASDQNAAQQRTKELTAIAVLERQKNDIRIDAHAAQLAAEKKTNDELAAASRELLKIQGKQLNAQNDEIELKYRDLIKRLEAEGNHAGLDLIDELINTQKAEANLADIERRTKETLDRLHAAEQSAQARAITGDTPQATADQQQTDARNQALTSLREQRQELQGMTNHDLPEYRDRLAEIDQHIAEISIQNANGLTKAIIDLRAQFKKVQEDMASQTVNSATDSLANMFTAIAKGTKSGKEALADFARSFADSMLQIATRALATYVVLSTLDAIYPGLGKATAASMGAASAGQHHTGGIAGSPSVRRTLPAFLFSGAPRYHSGGVAGLAPNEVPAVLQKGEEVLTKSDPRHRDNGGGQQGTSVRIINTVDPSMVHDVMNSSQGEEVIMNTISKNPGALRQILNG